MAVTLEDVAKIADLSKLRFNEDEAARFVQHFQEILDSFALLRSVPTEAVSPTYHALIQDTPETPMREDAVQPSLSPQAVFAGAPQQADDQFRVPKVIE